MSVYSGIVTSLLIYGSTSVPSARPQSQASREVSVPATSPSLGAAPTRPTSLNPATPTAGAPTSAASLPRIDWARLESEDYAVYAQNLRAAGLPERVVRQIMVGEVRASFDQDRMALLEREVMPFWDVAYGTEEEVAAELAQVAEQEVAFLAALIGPLDAATVDEIYCLRPKTAFRFGSSIEAGKRLAVVDIYDRAREAILLAPAEDLADALTRIDAQREAELAALLTPQEREDFEMRNSPLGAEIRHAIRDQGGQLNEEQFRKLFRLRQDLTRQTEAAALTGEDLAAAFERFEAEVSLAVAAQGL